MNILLTGAFGNLGSLVLQALLDGGHRVTALDVPSPINKKIAKAFSRSPDLTIVWGDIRHAERVKALVKGHQAVVHLAAIIPPFSEAQPDLAHAVNVDGTQHLMDGVRESGDSPLFIFSSSYSVYGCHQQEAPPCTLDTPLMAADHYSSHKIECERRVQAMPTPWLIMRLAGMVDGRMRHRDIEQAKLGFALAADNRIEYVHPADVATAIVHALERPQAHNKIHLIGGGPDCQVTQLDMMQAVMGAVGINVVASDFGTRELYADWADTRESQRLLDFQNHSFTDFKAEVDHKFRFLRPLLKPLSPLLRWGLMKVVKGS
ncbi:MAG TPA: NAD(P)-dependent oxidoreductase [Pseudomonadales bacterium]